MPISEEMKATWRKKIATVIEAKGRGLIILNEWETTFIYNIEYRMNHTGDLTIQQSITLNNIYGRLK